MLPLQTRRASAEVIDFMIRLLSFDPTERPPARDCLLHPWFSSASVSQNISSITTQILPPVEITASPKTVRATPRLPSPETDSSDDSFRSSSPPASSSSSSETEDESTIKPSISNAKVTHVDASFFSDRMDICSISSQEALSRNSDCEPFTRISSPMNVDTMKPAEKVWCILYPLPDNAAGRTALFLRKPTITIGSDTSADIILRHVKIGDHHCTITSASWTTKRGPAGILHFPDCRPITFYNGSTIFLLQGATGNTSPNNHTEIPESIGYVVKFPACPDHETSMIQRMGRLQLSTSRSGFQRSTHFYAPYSPSKRRRIPDSNDSRPRPAKIRTAPQHYHLGLKGLTTEPFLANSAKGEATWGILKSKTSAFPDIVLTSPITSLGEIVDFVDMDTGERVTEYSKCTSVTITDLGRLSTIPASRWQNWAESYQTCTS